MTELTLGEFNEKGSFSPRLVDRQLWMQPSVYLWVHSFNRLWFDSPILDLVQICGGSSAALRPGAEDPSVACSDSSLWGSKCSTSSRHCSCWKYANPQPCTHMQHLVEPTGTTHWICIYERLGTQIRWCKMRRPHTDCKLLVISSYWASTTHRKPDFASQDQIKQ